MTLFASPAPLAADLAPLDQQQVAVVDTDTIETPPWPDAFGVYVPDVVVVETAPVEQEVVVNVNYTLTGLFASATAAWAIVADGGGEYLVREGDELPGGGLVTRITKQGVELETPQGPQRIAFEEN
ncbi:hypothetical protein [Roseobacter sp. N2S]|uniref:hypothetical protein n=1 Tax=Roseobacter sp. N2S TaxID=2663844 RepID=UPI00285F6CC9|nr:hypothetical protein [Roseobacter sp. N2S]MDR6267594.1 hypothetical protein [Roseobacter sp. N2S]